MSKETHPFAVLRGHQGDVQALTFDHSENYLISGCATSPFPRFLYTPTCRVHSTHIWHIIYSFFPHAAMRMEK